VNLEHVLYKFVCLCVVNSSLKKHCAAFHFSFTILTVGIILFLINDPFMVSINGFTVGHEVKLNSHSEMFCYLFCYMWLVVRNFPGLGIVCVGIAKFCGGL